MLHVVHALYVVSLITNVLDSEDHQLLRRHIILDASVLIAREQHQHRTEKDLKTQV